MLVSKIICNKLPRHFLIELFRETSTNYPSFNQLLQVYQNILTRLKVNCKDNGSKAKDGNDKGAKPKMVNKSSNNSDNKPGEAKFKSSKCRFCGSPEHTTINCDAYPSVEARVSLADKKGWCTKCLSGKHLLDRIVQGKVHLFLLNVINVKKQSIMLRFAQLRILPVRVTLRVLLITSQILEL